MAEGICPGPVLNPRPYDPVLDLSGDVAAICLSFVGIRQCLGVAQHVSHSWRHAIDGALPALWREVHLNGFLLTDARLADVVQKSRGEVQSIRAFIAVPALHRLRHFSKLRVLVVQVQGSVSPLLRFIPLLEELSITQSDDAISLPPLQFLKTVRFIKCWSVSGIHNLPALTKLEMSDTLMKVEDAWPASLCEVTILRHYQFNPRIVERIASLPQPTFLATDWSFANRPLSVNPSQEPPACIPGFTTLQRLTVSLITRDLVFKNMGAMVSLHGIRLQKVNATDQDMQCLAQLTNLQNITLIKAAITNDGLRHVCSLPDLFKLHIESCTSINDYSSVGICSNLKELGISYSKRRLSLADVQAITKLHQLEKMTLVTTLDQPELFSYFCTMVSLREMEVVDWSNSRPIPATVFASLPSLCLLESIRIHPIVSKSELVDRLVLMPKLRHVFLSSALKVQDEVRLRDALPRLETLKVLKT